MKKVSFIIPTIGRETLVRTLQSIEMMPNDEVLILGDVYKIQDIVPKEICNKENVYCLHVTPGKNWGATERNIGMSVATGDLLSFMDDDDVYAPEARTFIEQAVLGHPTIFKMRMPSGLVLWQEQRLYCGNVGTPMIVVPNDPLRLGRWSNRYICDYDFISSCKWSELSWNENIICQVKPE